MHKKYLRHYLQHILHDLKQNYLSIKKRARERNVHDFRVAVKKINALFDLLAFQAPGKFTTSSQINQVKRLYKLLGRIRDAQIGGMLYETYSRQLDGSCEHVTTFIRKKEKTSRKQFSAWKKDTQARFSPTVLEEDLRQFFHIDNQELIRSCDRFGQWQFQNIQRHLQARKDEKWHKVRMESKSIRYTLELGQKLSPDSEREMVLDKIKLIGDLLGDWHDRIILTEMAKECDEQVAGKADLNPLIKTLRKDRSVLQQTANLYIKELGTKQYFAKSTK